MRKGPAPATWQREAIASAPPSADPKMKAATVAAAGASHIQRNFRAHQEAADRNVKTERKLDTFFSESQKRLDLDAVHVASMRLATAADAEKS